MEPRELRGLQIAALSQIDFKRGAWSVPSQSGSGRYRVKIEGQERQCSCPDFESRQAKCKHIFAVEFVIRRENKDGQMIETRSIRVTEEIQTTYRQVWPAYNQAQVNEKERFLFLLRDLCAGIEEPPREYKRGRPPIPKRDAIFSAAYKVYSTVSGRRFMSDLRDAKAKGFIDRLPCYNSIFNVFDAEDTFDILRRLIGQSSLPLAGIETDFAADSSGFSSSRFDRWHVKKHGTGRQERWRAWTKCHIMCGVRTNIVTAVKILGSHAHDGNQLPELVRLTAENFEMSEVSADAAYSTERNLYAVAATGATPFIPFKRNAKTDRGGLWERMLHFYRFNQDEFLERYHKRSNVESTFAMVKAKFGDSVRSKTDRAMKNEVLAKLLCHNICCVIQSIYELGIEPVFWPEVEAV